jgi:hypothetical protein
MRIGPGFGFALLVASAVCAQTRSGGSVSYPGGAGLPGVTRSLGSVVNPAQGGLRVPGSRGGGVYNGGRVVAAYPVYVGGYYYPASYYASTDPSVSSDPSAGAAPSTTNVTVVMPPQQPVTPVVINYNYGSAPSPPPDQTAGRPANAQDDNSSEPSHYLIAFKDHTIYAATAYWVDSDTLHYFTAGNVHNQASLALVDRDFTERLNKEAGLDVRLPAPSSK